MPAVAQNPAPLYASWRERYEVVRKIGSGASAEVFEALDHTTGEAVALKVIGDGRMSGRVVREVEAAAALSHPNIVTLLDWFGDGEHTILVWELVDGSSLDQLRGTLGDDDVAAVGAELLWALAFAHSQGIIHRDVKPQNVMLDGRGHVKVMDFGIARLLDADTLTGDGDVIGTVAYMSPEQAAGRRVGPPSDVYSAALVVYELLAGENPLRGSSPAETLANVTAGRLPSLATLRPDLPVQLVEAVDAACRPLPGQRPSADVLAAELDELERDGLLRSRPLHGARRLWASAARLGGASERAGGAALAALTSAVVLGALPAYPASWSLPIVALSAALWAVVPPAGLAWLLGVLAFPVFAASFGLGVAYLVFAVALFLLTRDRPIVAVWPALALLLTPFYLTLVAPAAAAALGRVRGPLAAAWAAAGTLVYLVCTGATDSPFALHGLAAHLGPGLTAAGPFTAASRVLGVVFSPPAILQMLLWAGLAAALGFALTRRSLVTRLWCWSLTFAALFVAYRVIPSWRWGHALDLTALVLNVALAASVILLPVILATGNVPEDRDDGHLQVDQ